MKEHDAVSEAMVKDSMEMGEEDTPQGKASVAIVQSKRITQLTADVSGASTRKRTDTVTEPPELKKAKKQFEMTLNVARTLCSTMAKDR